MPPGRSSASSTGAPEAMPAASPVTPPPRISLSWYSCVISGRACLPQINDDVLQGAGRKGLEPVASVASSPIEIGSSARQLSVVMPAYNEEGNMPARSTTCCGRCLYGHWQRFEVWRITNGMWTSVQMGRALSRCLRRPTIDHVEDIAIAVADLRRLSFREMGLHGTQISDSVRQYDQQEPFAWQGIHFLG